ncbi:MAG TPA: HAMP domain-containing sensor histidine kinase [Ignavibacteriaceae bacterium]|nr:HAMP domain-containing sensor histidine kinase [Ignavibacteriaceae bacterium]
MKKNPKTNPSLGLPFHTVATLKERLIWYINLRWIAVIAVLVSVPLAEKMLGFKLAFNEITVIASLLLLINIVYFFLIRYLTFKSEYYELAFAEIQIIIDLLIISLLIHYSGGIGNPFYFLYIVQVILSGILFPGVILPYINAAVAALLLTMWSILEHLNFVARINLRNEEIPLTLLITSLAAFYVTIFAGVYIINNFMMGYRSLKSVIDEKNLQLEKAIQNRSKAFRYAAHELKSPMTAIQSTLEVVKNLFAGELKPEVKDMIFKAENRSSQVLNMIKEMITITQYNLGLEQPEFIKVEFNEWLCKIVNQHAVHAFKKNINFKYCPSKNRLFVKIDAGGFEKVVSNLINNAIKYTPDSGRVTVETIISEDNYGFKVTDSGIGIAKEDLNKIFDEFFRSKNAREIERIGTGLGLNLVHQIVTRYDGNIYVKSELGKGSEFTVEIPYALEEELEISDEKRGIL